MASLGPNNPATAANDATLGSNAWSNTSNAFSSNNSYATATLADSETTQYLKLTNFGFAVPSGNRITGIVVEIEKSRTAGSGTIKDNAVRIVKGGTPTGNDLKDANAWSTSDAYTSYGNSTELWGVTWTVSDINSSGFGVAISAHESSGAMSLQTAQIDHVRITVYYTPITTLEGIIRDPVKYPYRKAEIKRRQSSDALYESSWQDITKYVERWGTLQTSLDDQRLNQFVHSGVNLQVRNDYGEFNPEYEGQSLFYGYLTRYRTLLRIQAGYTDGSGNIFPSDTTQGIFILDGEIQHVPKSNTINLNFKSIISPFQETRASEIDGITSSITSSEIIAKIRDATDGSGNFLFRNFITTTAWDIDTTTRVLTGLGTTTSRDQFSVWEMMVKLAEIENFVVHATRTGGILFGSRRANTTTSQFSLYGASYPRPNIIQINSFKEAVNKLYTHIRFKFMEDETATSYVEGGTQTTVDARSPEWKYGRRTYEMENAFFSDSAEPQAVASRLANEFANLRSELNVDIVFSPHLELLDHVDVSYREGSLNSIQLWDARDWAADTSTSDTALALTWASETTAAIEFNQKSFKIISRKTNLDTFATNLILREIEG